MSTHVIKIYFDMYILKHGVKHLIINIKKSKRKVCIMSKHKHDLQYGDKCGDNVEKLVIIQDNFPGLSCSKHHHINELVNDKLVNCCS